MTSTIELAQPLAEAARTTSPERERPAVGRASSSPDYSAPSGRRVLVTGARGFIGSHLVEALAAQGADVAALDMRPQRFPDTTTDPGKSPAAVDLNLNLVTDPLDEAVAGCDVVFHLAARPGVRGSWGGEFEDYLTTNVLGTRRLMDACLRQHVRRLVFASSSSVYGTTVGRSRERDECRPLSPYGVTKLAAEQLCLSYARRTDSSLSTVALRYFTVYGPRQRPDMALGRILFAAYSGMPLTLYGDGTQRREFTYVSDVVAATVAAAAINVNHEIINVGGGASVSLIDAIAVASQVTGRPVPLNATGPAPGDVQITSADLCLARELLGYEPHVDLVEGLTRQAEWMQTAKQQPILDAYTYELHGSA